MHTVHLYHTELDSSRPQRSKDALRRTRSTVQYKIGTQYCTGEVIVWQMTGSQILQNAANALPSQCPLYANSVAVTRIFGPPTEWLTAQI